MNTTTNLILGKIIHEVESRLSLASLHLQQAKIISGLVMVFVYTLALVVILGLVDLLIPLPTFARFTILISLAMLFVWSIWFRVVVNCIRSYGSISRTKISSTGRRSIISTCPKISQNEPEDVVQRQIWDRLAKDVGSAINNIDFTSVVDLQYWNRIILSAILLLMGIGLLVKHFPEQTETSIRRILMPWQRSLPVLATQF